VSQRTLSADTEAAGAHKGFAGFFSQATPSARVIPDPALRFASVNSVPELCVPRFSEISV
jgi:hypothetical protein